jgi:predicted alpha/beta hydrolase
MLIRTADGCSLHATLFDANSDRVMLVAAAMGVKRRYYDAYAQHLASRGVSVVTFDYRGIGDSRPQSLRGFEGSMLDWGRYDIPAAIDWIVRELRPKSLAYTGHSCGGQLAGAAPNVDAVDRFLFVCAQSGYWRHWPRPRAYGLGALWLAMPLISRLVGYFPSKLFGLGSEDLPRHVASQWGTWGRHPEYLFADVDPAPYARVTAPILAYSFRDDHYAPKRAVEALLAKYSGAPIEHRHVETRGFGHFDFFRRGKGEQFWEKPLATPNSQLKTGRDTPP